METEPRRSILPPSSGHGSSLKKFKSHTQNDFATRTSSGELTVKRRRQHTVNGRLGRRVQEIRSLNTERKRPGAGWHAIRIGDRGRTSSPSTSAATAKTARSSTSAAPLRFPK